MNSAGIQDPRTRPENAQRPSYLFSGLIKCDCRGRSYTVINKTRYGCVVAQNKGNAICTNRSTIEREVVEDRVLTGLRDSLVHPELIATFVEEYRRALNADAAQEKATRDVVQVERKITGILAAIEAGKYQPRMKGRMAELEAGKFLLTDFLSQSPEPPAFRLPPSLTDLYQFKIRKPSSALRNPAIKIEATEALCGLVSEIGMIPNEHAPNGHHIELAGHLAGIL
ncbi:zinc ribbon domain-containing protein [uncultured Sulfitobacter sp.]|uniref:zinc ribbon domain-containing protein n=1 Tax=uncultured Sulfitobacter sp. TaxID=191468 RepID=UPI00262E7809|nr:zinc ribbon domain-containing protein [uncultured Sulfitobacter sp.]